MILCIISIFVVGCTDLNKSNTDNKQLNTSKDVTMYISEKSYLLGDKKITINIKNNTSEELYYGEAYEIEYLKNNIWYEVPFTDDASFTDIGIILGPNKTNTHEISLDNININLKKGKYRIIKQVGDAMLAAEFKLK
ncbi:immunoglobulin-like domain-containing protein [Romboutsia weinsteinii]|nr:immunoglobulin-like domain-containing protein [Romboutsia weinsteinii]